MADETKNETQGEDQAEAEAKAATQTGQARGPQGQQVQLEDTNALAAYANFCRVSSTPEELILDLGLNPQPFGTSEKPIRVDQRIVMNHFTAKRLLTALAAALQRHEQAFGVLETDVRKRVVSSSTNT